MTKSLENYSSIQKNFSNFKFIDLFAGIGGFHFAMHELGGECVFASEIDEHARKTYEHNFQDKSPLLFKNNLFNKDIKTIMPQEIPDFDVLCAGFPCQSFSQVGLRKGFEDTSKSERGNLFFDIVDIIKTKRPKAYFLENVRGLVSHDQGRTFETIRNILVNELHYSFYYQIVKASDYGLPQLRPRTFIVGFRDDELLQGFNFPNKLPLKYTMSDVWEGVCSREIGFTLRVGGRGSNIDDRRNWDAYLVNGEVKRITPKEAKRMQGFPDNYHFPVSKTQAMKQLGNSVAIDAIKEVGKSILQYIEILERNKPKMNDRNNKGEWTELFTFVKLLKEQKLSLCDSQLNQSSNSFFIKKITTRNLDVDFHIESECEIKSINNNGESSIIDISNVITNELLTLLCQKIKDGEGRTFTIDEFQVIQDSLGFQVVKGGTSSQKSDIVLDIENDEVEKENEGFGIKSYLGAKPTLLNASGNTNFLFRINNLLTTKVDDINAFSTTTKLKDRINAIIENGGSLAYLKAEKDTMNYNLKMIDTSMPEIIGYILIAFYQQRISKISDIVTHLCANTDILSQLNIDDELMLKSKIKKLLVGIMLGFFAGTKWDGEYESNGTIVVKNNGDLVGFHIIEMENMENYLYENIKLDTPSTSRHKYGSIIQSNNELFFKLNLQLRF